MLIGLVLALFGGQVLRIVLFPLVYLMFMVPLPLVANVSFQLKLAAARMAVGVLDVLGLPAVREGSFIHIPTGTVVVDDVCSGLKYVISLMAFGALYAHISSVGRWQKAVLFLVSIPISFAANVLRVTLMVLIGYFWGTDATQKWYLHGGFGFLLFAVAFILLFVTEALLLKASGTQRGEQARTLRIADPKGPARHASAPYRRVYGIALAALLVTTALSTYLAWPRKSVNATDVMGLVALQQGPWRGTDYQLDERTYAILGTHDVLSRVYTDGPRGRCSSWSSWPSRPATARTRRSSATRARASSSSAGMTAPSPWRRPAARPPCTSGNLCWTGTTSSGWCGISSRAGTA